VLLLLLDMEQKIRQMITHPTLSISSSKKTGLATPTFLRPWTIRPGIAAT
jgi:hypothetical protein